MDEKTSTPRFQFLFFMHSKHFFLTVQNQNTFSLTNVRFIPIIETKCSHHQVPNLLLRLSANNFSAAALLVNCHFDRLERFLVSVFFLCTWTKSDLEAYQTDLLSTSEQHKKKCGDQFSSLVRCKVQVPATTCSTVSS